MYWRFFIEQLCLYQGYRDMTMDDKLNAVLANTGQENNVDEFYRHCTPPPPHIVRYITQIKEKMIKEQPEKKNDQNQYSLKIKYLF